MSIELKACPFCGCETPWIEDMAGWEIGCPDCGALSPAVKKPTKSRVIEAWNTRQSPWIPISSGRDIQDRPYVVEYESNKFTYWSVMSGQSLRDLVEGNNCSHIIAYMPIEPYTQEDES
ncbi:MAG: Lar family restriction alleviation protein [Planctomycetota bacterium]|jgi:Lar family restriction alleviation protein